MPKRQQHPELAIIVPVRNEAAGLPELFRTLADQREVSMELVLCDGHSTDGTTDLSRRMAATASFPVTIVESEPGRGRQLNIGAAAAQAPCFLFLHADSQFTDPLALRQSLDHLAASQTRDPGTLLAGRFSLRFRRRDVTPSRAYYYYECKARLDRPECIHGDQGFLMGRETFAAVGPFDDSLPMLAETRLAEAVRRRGRWLLLPAEIRTSARRFEREGLSARQALNAITMNFAAQGWEPFFRELPRLYGHHDDADRLHIRPILRRLGELIDTLTREEQRELWQATGRYIRDNAWQVVFALDTRRNFRNGIPPGAGPTRCLTFYDRHLGRLTDNAAGRWTAALLARIWLRWGRF